MWVTYNNKYRGESSYSMNLPAMAQSSLRHNHYIATVVFSKGTVVHRENLDSHIGRKYFIN